MAKVNNRTTSSSFRNIWRKRLDTNQRD